MHEQVNVGVLCTIEDLFVYKNRNEKEGSALFFPYFFFIGSGCFAFFSTLIGRENPFRIFAILVSQLLRALVTQL